ncbi:MAG: thioredoxin family protein [Nanoarchaeota archaeon]
MKIIYKLIITLIIVVLVIYYFERANNEYSEEPVIENGLIKAPELVGISGFFNSDYKPSIKDLNGKVILIDFWTYTCINCIHTIPFLNEWHNRYSDKGLVIIGVHTPEFPFEKDANNVQDAIRRFNISYTVVQDNDYATWRAYQNKYWPRKYLIDRNGFIRYDHIGEGAYEETEKVIQELLAENGEAIDMDLIADIPSSSDLSYTPEIYAGYKFALPRKQDVANGGLSPDQVKNYTLPVKLEDDVLYLDGLWLSNQDSLENLDRASVVIKFSGKSANIVAHSTEPLEMDVYINDDYVTKDQAGVDIKFDGARSFVVVDTARLYSLIEGNHGSYTLKLDINKKGFLFNTFTFG